LPAGILTVNICGRTHITDKALNEFLRRAEAREWLTLFWHEAVVREV